MKKNILFVIIIMTLPFLTSLRGQESKTTAVPAVEIPSWVDTQIDETRTRFEAWRGADSVIVFPIVTDIHAAEPYFSNPPNFADTKYHILFAQRAAIRFGADFMADLGDIGFDRDKKWKPSTKEAALHRLEAQVNLYKDFPLPVLFAMGNHDSGRAYGSFFSELKMTAEEYGALFNGMIKRRGTPLVTGPGDDYGYYDVPEKKCRVFFLNTSDSGEIGYSAEQLSFLADHLRMPENYCAVILQHICIHPTIGKWRPVRASTIPNGDLCIKILSDFIQGTKGGSENISWDFSSNKGTSLAGVISGHSHFNNQAVIDGINFVITQGYGTISDDNLPEGADYIKKVDRRSTVLIDVAAIKPDKKEMKIFRIGAGGTDKDRTFHF